MDSSINDAVKFIGRELAENPDADRVKLIEEASRKFDLNPLQQEFLTSKFILNKE
jgi:hypothetical protein